MEETLASWLHRWVVLHFELQRGWINSQNPMHIGN